jgi:hypothetical protein
MHKKRLRAVALMFGESFSGEVGMALEKEQATYQRELPKLLESAGKFALVHEDAVVGVFDTYNDALKIGYDKFQLKPFLVKRIQAVEQVHSFTRNLKPCPI